MPSGSFGYLVVRLPGNALLVQLEDGQKRLRGDLHRSQRPHLLFVAPPDVPSSGDPDFYLRGGSEFRLRQGFPPENPCDAALAAGARSFTITLSQKEITL